MKYTRTAYSYTHKAFVEAFKSDPSIWEEKPDWGLRPKDQDALATAMDVLRDLTDVDEGLLFNDLPKAYRHRYDATFKKLYLDNFRNLCQRIDSGEGFYLRSVADELAFYSIIEYAKEILEERGEATDELDLFFEGQNQDTDFLMLFDPRWDGVENDEDLKRVAGVSNLKLDEWFNWFDNVS